MTIETCLRHPKGFHIVEVGSKAGPMKEEGLPHCVLEILAAVVVEGSVADAVDAVGEGVEEVLAGEEAEGSDRLLNSTQLRASHRLQRHPNEARANSVTCGWPNPSAMIPIAATLSVECTFDENNQPPSIMEARIVSRCNCASCHIIKYAVDEKVEKAQEYT